MPEEELVNELSGITGSTGGHSITEPTRDANADELQQELTREQIEEQKQRRKYRGVMFWCFFGLLIFQYLLMAIFICVVLCCNLIMQTQALFSVIIPATFVETYGIIQIMVKFIFSPGDFKKK